MDVAAIISELDDHGFADTSSTRKVAVIQDVIWQIEGIKPWPFLRTTWTLNFDGTNPYPTNWASLSPAFRASIRLKNLATGNRILPVLEEEFEDKVGTNYAQGGNPTLYYFGDANQLNVWPIPPAGSTLKMVGTRWSDPITESTTESGILIPKYFHRGLIVNGALQRLSAMEDDTELAPVFQSYQQAAMDLATETLFTQQYDRRDRVKVIDPDSWDYGDVFAYGPIILNP